MKFICCINEKFKEKIGNKTELFGIVNVNIQNNKQFKINNIQIKENKLFGDIETILPLMEEILFSENLKFELVEIEGDIFCDVSI